MASVQAVRAFLGLAPEDVIAVLLTITHPDLSDDIRVTDNGEDITSGGNKFISFPFSIELPTDNEQMPVARLTIANVDGSIGKAIDLIRTPPSVKMQVVLVNSPNTIELEFSGFKMINVTRNAVSVEADIILQNIGTEPWPSIRVIPSRFPALFS